MPGFLVLEQDGAALHEDWPDQDECQIVWLLPDAVLFDSKSQI